MVTESNVPHPIAAGVVAALTIAGIGYGAYHAYASSKAPALERALFEPYFLALSTGRGDEAWSRFTTLRYKLLFPSEAYRSHWAEAFAQSGPLKGERLLVANQAYEIAGKRAYTSVRYQLSFERAQVLVVYEVVVDAQGTPRIDWAGQPRPPSSFTPPEPW